MTASQIDLAELRTQLDDWARALGFSSLAVSAPNLQMAGSHLRTWLAEGCHGTMTWFERSVALRTSPDALVPGTLRVISVTLPYARDNGADAETVLADGSLGYVSRYALGRDYHRTLRQRLAQLARCLAEATAGAPARVFVDSAPVMEVELAVQAGLGWRGKHTLLLNRQAGSWFFLGELFTNLPLPVDAPVSEHCGRCTACIDACPTGAIVGPYLVDARRCISYLTIEHDGPMPLPLRAAVGNRIYGCDDCQLVCPWNRDGPRSAVPADFAVRNDLDASALTTLFAWTAEEFELRLAGSPIRRIGHIRWLRNIAIALGNGPDTPAVRAALTGRCADADPVLREHVQWALTQLQGRLTASNSQFPASPC
jgi:epoxyqueuosine reductase